MTSRHIEVFFLLAIGVHIAFFFIVSIQPANRKVSSIPERVVHTQPKPAPVEKKAPEEPIEQPVERRAPIRVAQLEDPMIVIPVPVNRRPKWIVELIDVPREEDPKSADYVSERPSKVEEELQAERTAREPKPSMKRKKTGGKKKLRRYIKKRQPRKRARKRAVALRTKPKTRPKPEIAAAGIPTKGPGNLPVRRGDEEAVIKPSKKTNLFPTLGELAEGLETPPKAEFAPGVPIVPGGESDMPGIPSAPDNFLPLVKKRGPITLLNAKSYKFAGFVRRVAMRIFDRFVAGFKPRWYGGTDYMAMKKGASYEAVMNRSGRTVNIKKLRSSGSSRFDSLAADAVKAGAWDTNVPDGAECADGFVHYIFKPRIIPKNPITGADGSRVYSTYWFLATAGIKECE